MLPSINITCQCNRQVQRDTVELIQSSLRPFRLVVSSDLALKTPFWTLWLNWWGFGIASAIHVSHYVRCRLRFLSGHHDLGGVLVFNLDLEWRLMWVKVNQLQTKDTSLDLKTFQLTKISTICGCCIHTLTSISWHGTLITPFCWFFTLPYYFCLCWRLQNHL
jgi:hypothetical protein